MTDQIQSGLLIIGVSSTVLFDGETSTTELILLNLATGVDFSLPVSEEQATVLFSYLEPMVSEEGEESVPKTEQPTPINRLAEVDKEGAAAFAKKIGVGGLGAENTSTAEAEKTPQF
jgi:hypothetical protein